MLTLVAIPVAAAVATVQSSFFEWAFHRYWLHRPWLPEECFRSHTMIHHQLCKFEDTFHVTEEEQEEALTFAWWGGPVLIAINMMPWLLLTWILWSVGVVFPYLATLVTLAATVAAYYVGYEGLHYLMHKPLFPLLENSRYFKFIKRHHRIHHVQMDKNLNVLLPIADFFLGTLVTREPQATPRTTSETARRIARRQSKFGRRLRAQKAKGESEPASD